MEENDKETIEILTADIRGLEATVRRLEEELRKTRIENSILITERKVYHDIVYNIKGMK